MNKQAAVYAFVCLHPSGVQVGRVVEAMTAIGIDRGYVIKCLATLRDAGRLKKHQPDTSRTARFETIEWSPA